MRVLVACEFSGVVREAFRGRGHDAWSCDLLPCEADPTWHLTGDVRRFLDESPDGDPWDLMIAHPPCTYLCSSGLHWNKRVPGRDEKTEEALDFVRSLMGAPIKAVAIENPIGRIGTAIRKADQVIQPWQFGHDASKATALWLKNLPPLRHTSIVPPGGWKLVKFAGDLIDDDGNAPCPDCGVDFGECDCFGPTQDGIEYAEVAGYLFGNDAGLTRPTWANQTKSGQNKIGPSATRWMERSRTYSGIAEAMASQLGAA